MECDLKHYTLFCHSRHFSASLGTSASSKVIRPCGIEHAKYAIRRFLKPLDLVIGARLVGGMMSNALLGKILNLYARSPIYLCNHEFRHFFFSVVWITFKI
jgi:hypothetical protein